MSYSYKDLKHLVEIDINSYQIGFSAECLQRLIYWLFYVPQIKNAVFTAYAVITRKGCQVNMSHFEVIITVNKNFKYDFRGVNQVGYLQSYVYLSVVTDYRQAFIIIYTYSLIRS